MPSRFQMTHEPETELLQAYRRATMRRTVITPLKEEPDPASPTRDLWADTPLGEDEEGAVVTISARDRCEHTLLLGKTGQGKSNLMRHCMRQDLACGRGFVCLDPHGKLIDDVMTDIPRWRQNDVVYLDLADEEYVIGLNLFAAPRNITPKTKATMISQLLQIFDKCWKGGFSGTAEIILKSTCQTFLDNRRGTLATIPKLLTDREYREAFYPRITDPYTLIEWQRITNAKTGELKREEIDPIMRRLNTFVGNPIVRNIMGQERTTLDFPGWMDEAKIVLIKIPDNDSDGIGGDAAPLLAAVLLQLIIRAAYGRAVGSPLWAVYCDEFQHYVTGDIPAMIQNIRKFGVGLFLGTQSFASIHEEAIRDALLGVGTLLCYQLTERDARIVAGEFREGLRQPDDWQADREGNLVYKRPPRMETASRLANLKGLAGIGTCLVKTGGREHRVTIPNLEASPITGPRAKRGRIIQRSREQYCRPRWAVERELRAELWPDAPDETTVQREDEPDTGTDRTIGTLATETPPRSANAPVPRTRRRGVIAPLPEEEGAEDP